MVMCGNALGQTFPEFNMSDTTITACRGILYDSGGPNSPYGNNQNLTTVIAAGGVITLTFQGQFQLEPNLDFVRVYNGPNTASPLLGEFTGTSLPPVLTANSGYATVVLTSDPNVAYGGFKLQWTSDQPVPTPPAISVPAIPVCNSSQLNLSLSTAVRCDWLTTASVTLYVNSQSVVSTSVTGNCNANGTTNLITATFNQPFSFNCPYNLELRISIPDNCGVLYPFVLSSSFNMTGCGIDATVSSTQNQICEGSCTSLQAQVTGCSTYTYAWSNGLPAHAGPHNVCPTQTTTYSVTITEQSSGQTATRTHTIDVIEAEIITPAQTVCQSAADIVMQATTQGTWSGTGLESDTNIFDPDSANAGINYIYFETSGCIDSVAFTVLPIEAQEVTAGCPGSAPFQLEAIPSGGTWDGPFTTSPGMFDPSTVGSYTVYYTLGTCTDTAIVNVDMIGGEFQLDSICQSVWFDTIPFTPHGGIWTGPGIVNFTHGVFSPSDAPAGDVELLYSIHGCDQIFNVFVKEIEIGEPYQTSCPTEAPLVMYIDPPIPIGGYWEGQGITNATSGLYNPSLIDDDSWTSIIYYAPNGCSDTTFIYNLQTSVDEDTLMFCINDDAIVLNEESLGGIGPWGGTWSGPGVYWSDDEWRFDPLNAGVGQHTITFSNNTCDDVVIANIYPNDLPNTTFEFCSTDEPIVLLPDLAPGGTWSGSGITNASTGLFDPSVAEMGSFFVVWEGPTGCKDSLAVSVEEFQQAVITGLNTDYCLVFADYTFGATPLGGTLSGSLTEFEFNPQELEAGDYEVTYTYTSDLCPETSASVSFTIHPVLGGQMSQSDTEICSGQAVTLTVNANGGHAASGYTYQWSNGGPSLPTNTSNPTSATTISVVISDGCSEPLTLSTSIEVLPPIEVVTSTSLPVCPGEQGWATAEVLSSGNFSIQWNGVEQDTVYALAGTVRNLLVTDLENGCTYTEAVVIDNLPMVSATFIIVPGGECISSDQKENVSIIDVSQNGTTGFWDFGNGITLPYEDGQSITQSYPGPGNYTVTLHLENDAGCEASSSQTLCIQSDDPVFIPDIFSPNGDGNNDVLFVRGFGIGKIDFKVYNRWGELVFSTNTTEVGWDGTFRGQPAQAGNYFYSFKMGMGNQALEKQGEIALVR